MYNLIIYLYLLGVAIYSRFNPKVRKMWRGERDAFRILREKVDPQAKYVWFHAASLGEFEQGRPLMEQLRRDHPEYKILLTFFSPSYMATLPARAASQSEAIRCIQRTVRSGSSSVTDRQTKSAP